jgi:Malate/lactate dehydrogenases
VIHSLGGLAGAPIDRVANASLNHEDRNHWRGKVGCACALAAVTRGSARTIVMVDRTRKRAKAVATDLRYGTPLGPKTTVVDGDYDDLADAGLVMITAGINEKAGGATDRGDPQGRLRLLDKNADIYRDIVPKIARAAPGAVILVVTDPPDPLADIARASAGHDRVLSTGTFLDSLRFRVHLAEHFDVDANQVEAQVIGEHGVSQVFLGQAPVSAACRSERWSSSAAKRSIAYASKSNKAFVTRISRSSKAMMRVNLASALFRHGSRKSFFATNAR